MNPVIIGAGVDVLIDQVVVNDVFLFWLTRRVGERLFLGETSGIAVSACFQKI